MKTTKMAPWGMGKEDYEPHDGSETCDMGCDQAVWESREVYEGDSPDLFDYPRPLYFCQECYSQLPDKRQEE